MTPSAPTHLTDDLQLCDWIATDGAIEHWHGRARDARGEWRPVSIRVGLQSRDVSRRQFCAYLAAKQLDPRRKA